MKIKFLGTAAAEGIPALFCTCERCKRARELGGKDFRTRSQSLINDTLMIDFPADTYHHSLVNGIELSGIHHYIITHAHGDHLYPGEIGMFGNGFARLPEDWPTFHFYGGSESMDRIAANVERVNYRVQSHVLEPFKTYDIAGMKVTPLKANHGTETPFIYIIESDGKRMLYGHDTGRFPKETEDYLYKNKPYFDLITFDCCYGTRPDKDYGGHMCFIQNIQIAERMRAEGMIDDNTKLCANHFTHNSPDILYENRDVYEKEGFIMAYDGLEVEF